MTTPWDDTPNGAIISTDGLYRYALWRTFKPAHELNLHAAVTSALDVWPVIIGLNPSTADHEKNDATINKELRFCKSWGYRRLLKLNVYAYRETNPAKLFAARKGGSDIEGPDNRAWLMKAVAPAHLVLCAWGASAGVDGGRMRDFLKKYTTQLTYLKLNKDGSPVHPLYQPGSLRPQVWR